MLDVFVGNSLITLYVGGEWLQVATIMHDMFFDKMPIKDYYNVAFIRSIVRIIEIGTVIFSLSLF